MDPEELKKYEQEVSQVICDILESERGVLPLHRFQSMLIDKGYILDSDESTQAFKSYLKNHSFIYLIRDPDNDMDYVALSSRYTFDLSKPWLFSEYLGYKYQLITDKILLKLAQFHQQDSGAFNIIYELPSCILEAVVNSIVEILDKNEFESKGDHFTCLEMEVIRNTLIAPPFYCKLVNEEEDIVPQLKKVQEMILKIKNPFLKEIYVKFLNFIRHSKILPHLQIECTHENIVNARPLDSFSHVELYAIQQALETREDIEQLKADASRLKSVCDFYLTMVKTLTTLRKISDWACEDHCFSLCLDDAKKTAVVRSAEVKLITDNLPMTLINLVKEAVGQYFGDAVSMSLHQLTDAILDFVADNPNCTSEDIVEFLKRNHHNVLKVRQLYGIFSPDSIETIIYNDFGKSLISTGIGYSVNKHFFMAQKTLRQSDAILYSWLRCVSTCLLGMPMDKLLFPYYKNRYYPNGIYLFPKYDKIQLLDFLKKSTTIIWLRDHTRWDNSKKCAVDKESQSEVGIAMIFDSRCINEEVVRKSPSEVLQYWNRKPFIRDENLFQPDYALVIPEKDLPTAREADVFGSPVATSSGSCRKALPKRTRQAMDKARATLSRRKKQKNKGHVDGPSTDTSITPDENAVDDEKTAVSPSKSENSKSSKDQKKLRKNASKKRRHETSQLCSESLIEEDETPTELNVHENPGQSFESKKEPYLLNESVKHLNELNENQPVLSRSFKKLTSASANHPEFEKHAEPDYYNFKLFDKTNATDNQCSFRSSPSTATLIPSDKSTATRTRKTVWRSSLFSEGKDFAEEREDATIVMEEGENLAMNESWKIVKKRGKKYSQKDMRHIGSYSKDKSYSKISSRRREKAEKSQRQIPPRHLETCGPPPPIPESLYLPKPREFTLGCFIPPSSDVLEKETKVSVYEMTNKEQKTRSEPLSSSNCEEKFSTEDIFFNIRTKASVHDLTGLIDHDMPSSVVKNTALRESKVLCSQCTNGFNSTEQPEKSQHDKRTHPCLSQDLDHAGKKSDRISFESLPFVPISNSRNAGNKESEEAINTSKEEKTRDHPNSEQLHWRYAEACINTYLYQSQCPSKKTPDEESLNVFLDKEIDKILTLDHPIDPNCYPKPDVSQLRFNLDDISVLFRRNKNYWNFSQEVKQERPHYSYLNYGNSIRHRRRLLYFDDNQSRDTMEILQEEFQHLHTHPCCSDNKCGFRLALLQEWCQDVKNGLRLPPGVHLSRKVWDFALHCIEPWLLFEFELPDEPIDFSNSRIFTIPVVLHHHQKEKSK